MYQTNNKEKKISPQTVQEKSENICNELLDKKALNLLSLDLSELKTFVDALIIVSATSGRHAQGLAEHVITLAKEHKYEYLHCEGFNAGQWILLDFNDLIVNIFQPEFRELYNLEGLWGHGKIIQDNR